MMTDYEMLKILQNGDFEALLAHADMMSASIIKNKIQEIPREFFEPRITIDAEENKQISLIQFSSEVAGMSDERKRGLMERYNIDAYDMKKLQGIIDSIKVAQEYGTREEVTMENDEREESYGFSLASNDKLSRAYPLWLAYLFADSKNPLADVMAKLKEDGQEGKYDANTIVGLIEHTNHIMQGRTKEEKKDFYIHSISGILEEPADWIKEKGTIEI